MHATTDPAEARAAELAAQLDCMTERDLCALASIAPATAEAWRKRGIGPAHIRFGSAYLYPRDVVAAFLRAKLRERRPTEPAAALTL